MLTLSYIVDKDRARSLEFDDRMFQELHGLLELTLEPEKTQLAKNGGYFAHTEVLGGLQNLSVNDHNKVIIHNTGYIDTLFKILELDPNTIQLRIVLNGLDKAKEYATKIMWNLAFNKECATKISAKIDILKRYADSGNRSLKENIHGILFELIQNQPTHPNTTVTQQVEPNPSTHSSGHIMISYQWGSQELVKKIAFALRDHGYNIWIDIEKMKGNTLDAMAAAVEEASVVLICMTKKYKDSPNCRSEAEYTSKLGRKFIPIILEQKYKPNGWLGLLLGQKLYYAFEEENFETTFKSLVTALGDDGKIGRISTPRHDRVESLPLNEKSQHTIRKWEVEDVIKWLQKEKLTQYQEVFTEQKINGVALLELASITNKDPLPVLLTLLKEELGGLTLGDRLMMTSALKELVKM